MSEKYTCNSPDELPLIAEKLINIHAASRVFAFQGEMGAGKTTFIKAICAYLKVTDPVSSPTFSIVNEYITTETKSLYHFDLYRLKSWTEMFEIGYEEYFYSGNYCLIEWPEKIVDLLPPETVIVTISVSFDGKTRTITY